MRLVFPPSVGGDDGLIVSKTHPLSFGVQHLETCIRNRALTDDRNDIALETMQVVGMLSVKDLLKEVTREKEEILTKVTDFKLGRGGFFEHT